VLFAGCDPAPVPGVAAAPGAAVERGHWSADPDVDQAAEPLDSDLAAARLHGPSHGDGRGDPGQVWDHSDRTHPLLTVT